MKRHHLIALFAALFVLAACSGDDAGPSSTSAEADSEATISMVDFAFTGATAVAVGDTVTVTNEDSVAHTWTAVGGEFDSGSLAGGDSFEHTFDEAGEYDFFCSVHPDMTGSITVGG
jgi:plastocyanin